MQLDNAIEGGAKRPVFTPTLCVETDVYTRNVNSALDRGLPGLVHCKPHGHVLSIVGGGPSIENTYHQLEGYVVGINGSLKWLKDKGIKPFACGLLDPRDHIADALNADKDVRYFVATTCSPKVFDKLQGCAVTTWTPSGIKEVEQIIQEREPNSWLTVGGGATMGLRWITLGYMLGFRRFHLHGMDSSFADGKSHAYADHKDTNRRGWFQSMGRWTSIDMLAQVAEFFETLEMFEGTDIKLEVFGDGLLQDAWKLYKSGHPGRFA